MPDAAATPGTVRLSERVRRLQPSATLAVNARVKALQAEGRSILAFGAGEPDFGTPEPLVETAVTALRGGRTRYEPVPGPPDARAAVAERLRTRNGIPCDADHVVLTVGGKSAIVFALLALLDPGAGQEVIVPTPAWVSYRPMIELAGGTVVEVQGAVERDFRITPEQLAAAITPNTTALVLNSPSNPCGTMYAPEELAALAEVLREHPHIAVLSDELYEQLVYGGIAHQSFAALPDMAGRTITIGGMSKAYAMTGWRLGWIAATGDGVAKAIARIQGQVTSHATSFCYPAIVAAMQGAVDDSVAAMRDAFAERGAYIHKRLTAIDGIVCPRPTGAFYVFPDISASFGRTTPEGRTIRSALTFAEALLEECDVAVVPGEDFGAGGERCVRFSFACSREQIAEGMDRLAAWWGRLAPASA